MKEPNVTFSATTDYSAVIGVAINMIVTEIGEELIELLADRFYTQEKSEEFLGKLMEVMATRAERSDENSEDFDE